MRYLSLLLIIAFSLHSESLHAQDEGLSLSSMKWRSVGPALTSGRIADMAGTLRTATSFIWPRPLLVSEVHEQRDELDAHLRRGEEFFYWMWPSIRTTATRSGYRREQQPRSVFTAMSIQELDGGKSWDRAGIERTHRHDPLSSGRSTTVYVAADGPLWNKGGERGIYKSTDGGKQWRLWLRSTKTRDSTRCTSIRK